MGDHMESLQAFKKYNRNGYTPPERPQACVKWVSAFPRLDVCVTFHPVKEVAEEDKRWTFDLMKTSVKD